MQPGYHLKPIGSNSFSCQKLSQISVRIYAGEEAEELFPSVLLSLSGEDGYRNNSITGAGGSFFFDYLFPGSFYLRPLLKVISILLYCYVSNCKREVCYMILSIQPLKKKMILIMFNEL